MAQHVLVHPLTQSFFTQCCEHIDGGHRRGRDAAAAAVAVGSEVSWLRVHDTRARRAHCASAHLRRVLPSCARRRAPLAPPTRLLDLLVGPSEGQAASRQSPIVQQPAQQVPHSCEWDAHSEQLAVSHAPSFTAPQRQRFAGSANRVPQNLQRERVLQPKAQSELVSIAPSFTDAQRQRVTCTAH